MKQIVLVVIVVTILHVTALAASIMTLDFVHNPDRSVAYKKTLLAFSGVTIGLALVGISLMITAWTRGKLLILDDE